jgi:uncharacterized YccA/Bax inhibitor family protein
MIEIASTTNPIFRNFPAPPVPEAPAESAPRMTFAGALRKTTILAMWTGVCAVWIWNTLSQPHPPPASTKAIFLGLMVLSVVAPFAMVWLSLWRKTLSPFTAPVYAMLQGVFFGFVSVALEPRFHGVVMQILCLTFFVCLALAYAYRFALIRPADHFNKKLVFALLGAASYIALAALLPRIGLQVFPLVTRGPGAAFSGALVIVAAVTFISVYDETAKSAEQNHPEYMEWHAALGLIMSMIWLYLEGLRLFIRGRVPNESHHASF